MNSLRSYFESEFLSQKETWEKGLLAELKLTELGNKAQKKMINGLSWPTLSLEAAAQQSLAPEVKWKKASNTYASLEKTHIKKLLEEDLKSGVRNFFFHEGALDQDKWKEIEGTLKNFSHVNEVEVFLLGDSQYESKSFKVIHNLITGKETHDKGGHSIQELALLSVNLIKRLESEDEFFIGVYVDSAFFHNIAKLRAARLLALKILEEEGKTSSLKMVALTSYQGWTLYERYSNILRNETSVASAYIGGADHVQSSGYNVPLDLETTQSMDQEHQERSLRIARNTTHILGLESMLGVVEDAAFGSFHLENLTHALCEESWKLMQRILKGEDISSEIELTRQQRLSMVKTRKSVISGINDYPDVKEQLKLKLLAPKFFRVARVFEELRLRMELVQKPAVYIALYGDYAALNARLNFVKNYFELLGLEVHETGESVNDLASFKKNLEKRSEEIIVLCAGDEKYPELSGIEVKQELKFIAGKFELPTYQNLFAGQDIYSVLEKIVNKFERRGT